MNANDEIYLLNDLKELYAILIGWEALLYCGVTIDWNYKNRTCDLVIPGYVEASIQIFKHSVPKNSIHCTLGQNSHFDHQFNMQKLIPQSH